MSEKATTANTSTAPASWTRKILHGLAFGFLFCTVVTELGLTSYIIHKHGRGDEDYPGKEYKNDIGLLLFSSIWSLLFVLSHPFLNLPIAAVFSFVNAVFWGAGAGILYQVIPFKGTRCGDAISSFPANWQPYAGECSKIVTIEAMAWMNWAVFVILFFAFLAQTFEVKRTARSTLYGA